MSVTLVTSFSKSGFTQYGRRMLESALLHLPKSIDLWVYVEEDPATLLQSGLDFSGRRVRMENLLAIPGGVKDFLAKHGNDPRKWGKVPGQEKINFRFACNKFAHKQFSVYHAAMNVETDLLYWADADTIFFADVPEEFFTEILPEPYYMCVLGRGTHYHPECGWFGLRVAHPFHKEFVSRYIDMLRTDSFLNEAQWHDSWLQWQVMKRMEHEGKIQVYNLSPGYAHAGHPWLVSPLARYADHMKGNRKNTGSSWKEDLTKSRPEEYWQTLPKRGQR